MIIMTINLVVQEQPPRLPEDPEDVALRQVVTYWVSARESLRLWVVTALGPGGVLGNAIDVNLLAHLERVLDGCE